MIMNSQIVFKISFRDERYRKNNLLIKISIIKFKISDKIIWDKCFSINVVDVYLVWSFRLYLNRFWIFL
jgi:hypothetical protein